MCNVLWAKGNILALPKQNFSRFVNSSNSLNIPLLQVANTPGAWVLTGGTNTGVMKHVGEALQGASKALIGIATYGIVTNKEHLLEDSRHSFGGRFQYHVASSLVKKGIYYSLSIKRCRMILIREAKILYLITWKSISKTCDIFWESLSFFSFLWIFTNFLYSFCILFFLEKKVRKHETGFMLKYYIG